MEQIEVVPSHELRNNYASVVGMLENHDRVIITNRGKGQAVPISFDDYKRYEEYLHHNYVRAALREAEEYAAREDAEWFSHDEFWASV